MTRLLAVELRRYLARRLMRVLGALVVGAIVVGALIAFLNSADDLAARSEAAAATSREARRACLEDPTLEPPEGLSRERFCRQVSRPFVEDKRFHLESLTDILLGTSVPLTLLAGVIGASSIGAEWHAGTVTTLLTWEPRRVRVLVAKIVVCAAVTLVATVLLQALLSAALTPVALLRGTTTGTGGEWFVETAGVVVRGAAVAAMAAVLGFSIAVVGRNTAAALGVSFVYLAVVEGLVRGLRPQWARWLLGDNGAVFVSGLRGIPEVPRSTLQAGALLLAYTFGAALIALGLWRVRDVT